MADNPSYVYIGKVGRSHGVKGFCCVQNFGGDGKHFQQLKQVELRFPLRNKSEVQTVEEVSMGSKLLLMKFADIDEPETVKTKTGAEIWVEPQFASPLATDEFYYKDLYGCELLCDNKTVALVVDIQEGWGRFFLEVEVNADALRELELSPPADGKVLRTIPVEDAFLGNIDTKKKQIELKDLWLLHS